MPPDRLSTTLLQQLLVNRPDCKTTRGCVPTRLTGADWGEEEARRDLIATVGTDRVRFSGCTIPWEHFHISHNLGGRSWMGCHSNDQPDDT